MEGVDKAVASYRTLVRTTKSRSYDVLDHHRLEVDFTESSSLSTSGLLWKLSDWRSFSFSLGCCVKHKNNARIFKPHNQSIIYQLYFYSTY